MWLLLALSVAIAAPGRVAASYAVGTDLVDLAISTDGLSVAMVEQGTEQIRIFDTRTWDEDTSDLAPCSSGDVNAVTDAEVASTAGFYVGCSDGTVLPVSVTDGQASGGEAITVGDGSILGLATGGGLVYAVEEESDGGLLLHEIDPITEEVDGDTSYPVTLGHPDFVDAVYNGTYLIIFHGDDNVSKVSVATGSAIVEELSLSSAHCVDAAGSTGGQVYAACGAAGVTRFNTGTNALTITLDEGDGLGDPTAIWIDESGDDAWMLVADKGVDALVAYSFSTSSGYPDNTIEDSLDLGGVIVRELVGDDGYVYATTDTGVLWVITENPWVEISETSAEAAISGDTVDLSFTSDIAGTWSLRLGADTDTGGTVLDSGTISADETVTTSFEVDDSFDEGNNALRVVVVGALGNGHDTVYVDVDNPPSRVTFAEGDLGFGEEQLIVSFDGVDDSDLDHYVIYLTTTAFVRSDYASGGPDFDGTDSVSFPKEVSAEPGEAVLEHIEHLTNGTTYYVAVRAVDAGGQEGPMSTVLSATPQETFSLSELSKEGGGCATGGGGLAPLGLLAAMMAGLSRPGLSRPGRGAAVLALGLGVGVAQAKDNSDDIQPHAAVQLRYGRVTFADDNLINDVFGETGNQLLWIEGGPTWRGIAGLDLGLGFFNESGYKIAEDGSASTETDKLMAFPVTVGGTLRLDVLREQPIVPYVSAGGDYWMWREKWEESSASSDDTLTGGKLGWHYAVGGQVLLDIFEPNRASAVQARSGIDDAYLTVEWRKQSLTADNDGIDFSSTCITAGLRLHY